MMKPKHSDKDYTISCLFLHCLTPCPTSKGCFSNCYHKRPNNVIHYTSASNHSSQLQNKENGEEVASSNKSKLVNAGSLVCLCVKINN